MSSNPTRSSAWVPASTYRVQLSSDFTFQEAATIVPYLADLGVGALYVSPIFTATPGSTHGYDVTDYQEINPELGGETGFRRLVAELRDHGLGLLIDFVPNHMGIGAGRNRWWQDVLENGPASATAGYFDIDWHPLKRELRDKVLLPILGDQYGAVLERGELKLRLEDGAFHVQYFEHPLPIAPETYPLVLQNLLPRLLDELEADDPDLLEYQSIVTALERLSPAADQEPIGLDERQREQIVAKRRLAGLLEASERISDAIGKTVRRFNGIPGEPESFNLLDELLARQPYRLAFWRVAGEEINYRRFFAINELAAIRQEVPEVFAASHELLLRLVAEAGAAGVRIDHPDGLWDPAGYFRDVQQAYPLAAGTGNGDVQTDELPLYVVVEKILEQGEELPEDWPVHGTVGYEFAASVANLFVDAANRRAFDELYQSFTGERMKLAEIIYEAKYLMMRTALMSEVNVLAQALNRISENDRHTRDFTLNSLRAAIREVIANFPVYRTYVVGGARPASDRDRSAVETAIAQARRRNPHIDPSVLEFLRDVLFAGQDGEDEPDDVMYRVRFSMKFQQLTGPVMAKSVEDTAYYRYNRLVSLNEVGGNPAQFGLPVASFHRDNAQRQRRWPHGLLTSSTHDTKRSEDVRARLHVLSEVPQAWRAAINRWTRLNRTHKTRLEGRSAPDRNDEYLLYQTLLGTWPLGAAMVPGAGYADRIDAYMEKATREAQRHSTWTAPNEAYERAMTGFILAILDPVRSEAFLADFTAFLGGIEAHGTYNALAQQVLKLTSPGVPDIYQGTELWDLSLVDPDNRRPVDYRLRAERLAEISGPADVADLLENPADGRIKLFLTQRLLMLRREFPDLFTHGEYLPLVVTGARADHICAYARQLTAGRQGIVVVVPRLIAGLGGGGHAAPLGDAMLGDTSVTLPEPFAHASLRNIFTGEVIEGREAGAEYTLPMAEILAAFPVAVLAIDDGTDQARQDD